LTKFVHQIWWQYCKLWGDLKRLELDLLNSSKLKKDENFICDEYTWTKIIFVKKHEKWEIIFKNEAIGDFLYEFLGEEWKWYKKR
jgi:hypothetical protein